MQIDEDLIRQVQSYIFGKTGIRYFGRVKMTPKNLMVSCPYHKGGQEHKPSCGIKLQNDEKGSVGLVHCFSCGITTDMSSMMKDLLGPIYNEDEVEAKFGFKTLALNASLVVPDKPLFSIPNIVNVSEGVLRGFRKYHPYLAQRGISENTARIYDIGFDDYIFSDAVSVIEWANYIAEILPKDFLHIHIEKDLSQSENYRKITITPYGNRFDYIEELI